EATAPPTTPAPSTTPPTAVADTTTSTTAATTTSTTTAPTTSLAPAVTVDPDDFVANTIAIIETAERAFVVYNTALNDPFNNEKVEAIAEVFTSRLVEGWMNIIEEYRENNFKSIPNPDGVPARYDVDINSVEVNLNNGTGSVQVCHLNTFVKVEVGGNADGSDRVVEDDVTERVEQLEMVREDGVWKINRASLPNESEILTSCG
ncbi:hypothetical protein, partial [Ilumatobacter sp.]|uniref:hypothetical protein n=1 Tax=Ilumatobacter sp. TaxID=1967498 RepID=UPI003AF5EB96